MMSYLKLRELWNECEKLDELAFNVFVEGLSEIHLKNFASVQSAKPCVAQKRTVCNRGRWEPQEDDLLHKFSGYAVDQKPCVASQVKTDREKWTPAEEDLLHKYCNEASSVAKGVDRFLRQTDSNRTPGACKLRVSVMRREGRW